MGREDVVRLPYEYLVVYTDNFSEGNYIGRFQFGKLYRGKSQFCRWTRYMMVKIWEVPEIYNSEHGDNDLRLMEEVVLLSHEMLINHPGMVKLYGYCCNDGFLAVVYEFKPFDSVFNLIPKECFTWLQRIKVALGLASLLRFLHSRSSLCYKPFVVHNLAASHLVLDEDYNPKLCDFGSISGGIFPDKRRYSCHGVLDCYGCIDISVCNTGYCSNKQDVFAFGAILLSLISKRVYTDKDTEGDVPSVCEWAFTEYEAFESDSEMKNTMFSLVHKSLAAEDEFCPADGHKITMLALQCVNRVEYKRPTMKHVVRSLLKLEVANKHSDFLEAKTVQYLRETPWSSDWKLQPMCS